MTRRRVAVRVALRATLLGFASLAGAVTAPTPGDLARCAGVVAPDARLACYDRLAGRSPDRTTPTSATTTTRAPTDTTAPVAASASDPQNFGLTPAQLRTVPAGPAAIQARITKFIDRAGGALVILDNGQTWSITEADTDSRLGPGEPVTIKRAALGSFLMVTRSKRSYHVRRAQ